MKKVLRPIIMALMCILVFMSTLVQSYAYDGTINNDIFCNYIRGSDSNCIELMKQYGKYAKENFTCYSQYRDSYRTLFVTEINDSAFISLENRENVKKITIPNHVDTIGSNVYRYFNNATELVFPKTLVSIGTKTFPNGIKDIYYGGTTEEWNKINKNGNEILNTANIHYEKLECEYKLVSCQKPTCISDGVNVYKCDCGYERREIIPKTPDEHVEGEWKVTIQPTNISEGEETLFCAVCNKAIDTRVIPKLIAKINKVSIPNEISLNYKETYIIVPNLSIIGNPDYTVSYASSNSNIVSINDNGELIAKERGNANITCVVTDFNGNTFENSRHVKVNYSVLQWII